jgi:aminoglycoside phosphotransferase (APT) family kinase protein
VPARRDPETTRRALERWIAARRPAARDVHVGEVGGPAATGYSHETIVFDAAWTDLEGRHERRLVARVKPTGHTVFPDDAFAAEYGVMAILAATDVPVPRVLGREDDPSFLGAPFFVMEHLAGDVPPDNPPYTFGGFVLDAAPEEQERLWWSGLEAMAAVHRVPWQRLGLGFLRAARRGAPGPAAELAYWRDYRDWVGASHPLVEDAFALAARELTAGEPPEPGLCWGDARIGNQVFRDFACVGVLDFEMATIADPEMDLGWFLFFDRAFSEGLGVPRPPGFPSHEATVERWEALTGRRARRLDAYLVFAGLRFALVMMRLAQLLEATGLLPRGSDFGTNNFALHFLGRLLAERRAGRR